MAKTKQSPNNSSQSSISIRPKLSSLRISNPISDEESAAGIEDTNHEIEDGDDVKNVFEQKTIEFNQEEEQFIEVKHVIWQQLKARLTT